MMGIDEESLLEAYMEELDTITECYEMMGKLLNSNQIMNRVKKLGITDMYIYGGGYLGIQLYRAVEKIVNVISIVDKSGGLIIHLADIPVMDMNVFKESYDNNLVVITPIKHYRAIYRELCEFVPAEKIMFLGEFQGGE